MQVADIVQLILEVGFPAAMCTYMIYVNDRNNKRNNEENRRMSDIINNNTIAITKLIDKLDYIIREK